MIEPGRIIRLLVSATALAIAATACSGSAEEPRPPDDLSPAGQAGWEAAAFNGCMSCHGRDGVGGTGPAWTGLAGSTRTLMDGTQVIADDDYLVRSIVEPQAERVNGYNIVMPSVDLTDEEVRAIVDYIEEIS